MLKVVLPGIDRCLRRGLSRVRRKLQARFLEGLGRETVPGYSTKRHL